LSVFDLENLKNHSYFFSISWNLFVGVRDKLWWKCSIRLCKHIEWWKDRNFKKL